MRGLGLGWSLGIHKSHEAVERFKGSASSFPWRDSRRRNLSLSGDRKVGAPMNGMPASDRHACPKHCGTAVTYRRYRGEEVGRFMGNAVLLEAHGDEIEPSVHEHSVRRIRLHEHLGAALKIPPCRGCDGWTDHGRRAPG